MFVGPMLPAIVEELNPSPTLRPTPRPTETPAILTCQVKTGAGGWVNLRTCASVNCEARAWARDGMTLQIVPGSDPGAEWLEIMESGEILYVYSQYCEVVK